MFIASACVPGLGLGSDNNCDASADNTELIALMPWVTRDICMDVNMRLGITGKDVAPPQLIGSAWGGSPEFTGDFTAGNVIIDGGNVLYGRPEGCFSGNGTPPAGSYHYYRVLMPR
jgi:hypothetical protein